MANLWGNAAFLDGTAGWTGLADVDLSVDDAALGAPGRGVLAAETAVDGAELGVTADAVALVEGQAFTARVLAATTTGDAVSVILERTGFAPQVLIPRVRAPITAPSRALSDGLGLHVATGTVPTSGNWTLRVVATGPRTGPRALCLFRPWLGPARSDGLPPPFDPGPHENADLNLPAWPAVLRPFQRESEISPIPTRLAFQTAAGINRTRRLFVEAPVDLRGRVRCTPAEADALEAFHRTGVARFWIVRPDTDQLCVGEWLADGSPRLSDHRGPTSIYDVGLQLAVA